LKGKKISQINIGDSAVFQKTLTESDVYNFAGVSGDMNPVHINEEFSKTTIFKTRIVHGMLTASMISTVIGMQLPGPGTIYLAQEIKFLKPVKINDTILAKVEVTQKIEDKNRIILSTICTNQCDEIVISGKAVVMPPK